MRKYLTLIVFFVLGCIITLLFQISQGVQSEEDKLKEIRSDIAQEQEKIRVYKSEWAYLIRPERLQQMAETYTPLVPQTGSVRVAVTDIPFPQDKSKQNSETQNSTDTQISVTNVDFNIQSADTDIKKLSPLMNRKMRKSQTSPYLRVSVSFKDVWGGKQ